MAAGGEKWEGGVRGAERRGARVESQHKEDRSYDIVFLQAERVSRLLVVLTGKYGRDGARRKRVARSLYAR